MWSERAIFERELLRAGLAERDCMSDSGRKRLWSTLFFVVMGWDGKVGSPRYDQVGDKEMLGFERVS